MNFKVFFVGAFLALALGACGGGDSDKSEKDEEPYEEAADAAKSACRMLLEEEGGAFGDIDVREVCKCAADQIEDEVKDDEDLAKPIIRAARLMKSNPEGMDEDDISTSDMIGVTAIQGAVKSCASE